MGNKFSNIQYASLCLGLYSGFALFGGHRFSQMSNLSVYIFCVCCMIALDILSNCTFLLSVRVIWIYVVSCVCPP